MPDQQTQPLGSFIEIINNDFSQGVNWVDDPGDLDFKEIADARNVRLTTHKVIEQREGYTQYNSSTIGASTEVRSLFHFRDYSGALIPLAQCSDNKLYKGSAAFPGTGSWTSILNETAGSTRAFFDALWGVLIYVNGVDEPQIWEGTYGKCYGFRVTQDNGATYRNYDVEVADEDTLTTALVGALDTSGNGDWILVKSRVPKLTGLKVVIGTANTVDVDMVVEYYGSGGWTAVSGLSDGTDSGGMLGQSGDITFTECTITPTLLDNTYGYFLRISHSAGAALTATTSIKALYLYYNIQDLPSLWDGTYRKPDGFVKTIDTGTTFVDYTTYVTDNALSTVATLGALPATTGIIYIKSHVKFRAVKVTMDVVNVNTAQAQWTAYYFKESNQTWTSLTIADGTATGSGATAKTLAQSGLITWTWPTDTCKTKIGQDQEAMWIIKLVATTNALSANVDICELDIIEYQDALKVFNNCVYHKNRVFLSGRADAPNYLFYSAEFKPDVWTGIDTGYVAVPSGKPITAMCRFYNELMVATDDEIYLLEGYSPLTFGLLKINTGNVGVSAPHSVVSVAKMIYFMHSTGFYRFDGIGVVLLSKPVKLLFDDAQTSYYIPSSRFSSIVGRYNRVWSTVEWTVSKGSSQTTNNLVAIFDIDREGWWMDDFAAAAFLKTESSTYQDLYYHGDYAGKVHRDYYGTSDNGTAIDAYFTTRAIQDPKFRGWLCVLRMIRVKLDVQSSGSVTVTYGASEATTLSSLGSLDMTKSGYAATVEEYLEPILGSAFQFKFRQNTKDVTFGLSELQVYLTPVRYVGSDL